MFVYYSNLQGVPTSLGQKNPVPNITFSEVPKVSEIVKVSNNRVYLKE